MLKTISLGHVLGVLKAYFFFLKHPQDKMVSVTPFPMPLPTFLGVYPMRRGLTAGLSLGITKARLRSLSLVI